MVLNQTMNGLEANMDYDNLTDDDLDSSDISEQDFENFQKFIQKEKQLNKV